MEILFCQCPWSRLQFANNDKDIPVQACENAVKAMFLLCCILPIMSARLVLCHNKMRAAAKSYFQHQVCHWVILKLKQIDSKCLYPSWKLNHNIPIEPRPHRRVALHLKRHINLEVHKLLGYIWTKDCTFTREMTETALCFGISSRLSWTKRLEPIPGRSTDQDKPAEFLQYFGK